MTTFVLVLMLVSKSGDFTQIATVPGYQTREECQAAVQTLNKWQSELGYVEKAAVAVCIPGPPK
jgi:hypothetical protein